MLSRSLARCVLLAMLGQCACHPSSAGDAGDGDPGPPTDDDASGDTTTNADLDAGGDMTMAGDTDPGGDTTPPQVFPPAMAYYPFEGTAEDVEGSHEGTENGGPSYSTGAVGLGVDLDGVDDYISVASSADFDTSRTSEMTFAMTVRAADYAPWQSLLSRRFFCNNEAHFNVFVQNRALHLAFYSDAAPITVTHSSAPVLTDGLSYSIVWIKKWGPGGYARLFINGGEVPVSDADSAAAACSYTLDIPLFIGAQATDLSCDGTAGRLLQGQLDDVRIWDRALAPEEIPGLCLDTFTVDDGANALAVSDCLGGQMLSLTSGGVEQLNGPGNLSRLLMTDGTARAPLGLISVGTDVYRLDFGFGDSVDVRISPAGGYYVVSIEAATLVSEVTGIELVNIQTPHIPASPYDAAWAASASDDTVFVDVLSLTPDTACDLSYRCRTSEYLDIVAGAVAVVVTPKVDYLDTLRRVVSEQGLPDVVMEDGEWLRQSSPHLRSYLLAYVTPTNTATLLDFATRGNLGHFVPISPVLFGSYATPRSFYDVPQGFLTHQDLVDALLQFSAQGIHLGLHTFLNRVDQPDALFADPASCLYSETVGELSGAVAPGDVALPVDAAMGTDTNYVFYTTWQNDWMRAYGYTPNGYYFAIDDEIVHCTGYSDTPSPSLIGCGRGLLGTTAAAHAATASVGYVPEYAGFFLNPDNAAARAASIAGFKTLAEEIDARFIYADASAFPPKPGADGDVNMHLRHKVGVLPYVSALTNFPAMQFGDDVGSTFAWSYNDRVASWDGVPFHSKAFMRDFKVATILLYGPYSRLRPELGWWRVHGGGLGDPSGAWDYEALSPDDVHYAMTKTLALRTSIGVQLGDAYQNHLQMPERFDLIGAYQRLIARDAATPVVPPGARAYLSAPTGEAYIVGDGDGATTLVRKAETRRYAQWDSTTPFEFSVVNPFGPQVLRVELRARPSYEGFASPNNTLLADLAGGDVVAISTSMPSVTCSILNGVITAQNVDPNLYGGCAFELTGAWNLAGQRGIGVAVEGDGEWEHLVVSLQGAQFGRRDFETTLNFVGARTLELGDPTTALSFESGGDVTYWPEGLATRSWGFDYRNVSRVRIYVNRIAPSGSAQITLSTVVALNEAGTSDIVQPSILVNAMLLQTPVTLSVADAGAQIGAYDGTTGILRTYSPNYEQRSEEVLPWLVPTLDYGVNTLVLNSTLAPGATGRAEITVLLLDDDDGDGVPTDGDYDVALTPCDGAGDFCDDNCPTMANSAQTDTDGDGLGDACDL